MAELPVLTRNVTPIRRIVEEHNCGYVLPADATPSETAARIRQLRDSEISHLGENGRDAVEEEYNWSTDAARVRESLLQLHERRNSHRSATSASA